ncbi:MAG: acyl carrier protein [Microcoleaceae cyanobacterium]
MPLLNQSFNGKSAPSPILVNDDPTFPVNFLASAEEATTLQSWLVNQIAERLGLEPDEIDIDEDFADYGLNSIEAVNLSGDLENILGRRLPPTILWDYPNIHELSQYLVQLSVTDSLSLSPSQEVSSEKAQQLLQQLDQLSDAEVDALLNSMLSDEEDYS